MDIMITSSYILHALKRISPRKSQLTSRSKSERSIIILTCCLLTQCSALIRVSSCHIAWAGCHDMSFRPPVARHLSLISRKLEKSPDWHPRLGLALYKTKYFGLRLSYEVSSERPKLNLRETKERPKIDVREFESERWRLRALDKQGQHGHTNIVTPSRTSSTVDP